MNQFEYLGSQLDRTEWVAMTRARGLASDDPRRCCGPEDDVILFLKIQFPFARVPTLCQAKRSIHDNPNCFSIKGDAIQVKQALDLSDGNARCQDFAGTRLGSHWIISERFDLGLTADKAETPQEWKIVLGGQVKIDRALLPQFRSSIALAFELPPLLPSGRRRSRPMPRVGEPSNSAGIAGSIGTAGGSHDSLPLLAQAGRQLQPRVHLRAGPVRRSRTGAGQRRRSAFPRPAGHDDGKITSRSANVFHHIDFNQERVMTKQKTNEGNMQSTTEEGARKSAPEQSRAGKGAASHTKAGGAKGSGGGAKQARKH